MPEEIVPVEEPPKEEILKPVEEKKEKPWLKPLLFLILGIILAGSLVFGGYKLGQRSIYPELVEGPTPTPELVATPALDPTANWKTYTNTKYGYSIRYPKEWQSFEVKEGPEAGIRTDFAESESFSEREYWVWTKVNNNPDGLSAKQWVDKLLLQYSDQQAVIAGIKREKDSVADVEAERVTGLPAMTEIVSVFIPKEKNIYEIVLQKGVGILSSENKDTFNLMLSTFRFSE